MAVDKDGKQLPKGFLQRKDGRYEARYTFLGKRVSLYDKNLKSLEKRYREALYEVEYGIHASPEKLTVDAWFQLWMENYKENSLKKATLKLYRNTYNWYIKESLGKKMLKDIRPEHIQKIYNSMHKQGYADRTIELVAIPLGGMYRQAIRNQLVRFNPVEATVLPRSKKKTERRVLTPYEQEQFVQALKGHDHEAFFLLALSTGLRIGELAALKWDDIDFREGMINIDKTLGYISRTDYILNSAKTVSSNRKVPLLPDVAKVIRKHKFRQAERRFMLGDKWESIEGFEDLLFLGDFGKPLNSRDIIRYIKRIVKKINKEEQKRALIEGREPIYIDAFTPHAMRHTFATRALENEVKPKVVQEILGHSSIKMTMDIYTHVLPETKSEEMKKLAHLF